MNDELFIFSVGSQTFRYTSARQDVQSGGQSFSSAAIYRGELSKDSLGDGASVICPFDLEPVPLYKNFNPSVSVYLQILSRSSTMLFFGRISSVEFDLGKGTATIKLSAMGGLMKCKIPTRTYSSECSFELFDEGCGLKQEDYRLILPASECEIGADKRSITHPKIEEKGADFFTGGFASYDLQHSFITSTQGRKLNLMFPIATLSASGAISIYAGCDKRIDTCKNKFKNSKNYGGFPFIPNKNPVTQNF